MELVVSIGGDPIQRWCLGNGLLDFGAFVWQASVLKWCNGGDFSCWGMACSTLVGLDAVGVRLELQMYRGLDLGVRLGDGDEDFRGVCSAYRAQFDIGFRW